MMRKVVHTSLWIVALAAIVALTAFSARSHRQRPCPGVDIKIDYAFKDESGLILLVYNDIRQALMINFDSLKGKRNEEVNPEAIEKVLKKIAYVKDCDVLKDVPGKVFIRVSQRKPIVRFYGSRGRSFYIDDQGMIMPVRYGFPARVLIVNGDIDDHFFRGETLNLYSPQADSLLQGSPIPILYDMARYISQDPFLSKEISQIYYQRHQITLTPLVGSHSIVMETPAHFREKLDKLEIFYKKGLGKTRWGQYKEINIEYKNQIVCTKN